MSALFTLLYLFWLATIKVRQFRLSITLIIILLMLRRWYLIKGNSREGRAASKISLTNISFEQLLENLIKSHLLNDAFISLNDLFLHFIVGI